MNLDRKTDGIVDVAFIGTGPVALYGMYYAGLRMMSIKAIDMLGNVGGGLMALYPEKYIYDVAGFPKVLAKDLIREMKKQATQVPHSFHLEEKVTNLEKLEDGIICLTTCRGEHLARAVVVCAGLGAYVPKPIDVPDVKRLEGHGVYYFCRRLNDFADKNILIVGGGDSAFDYSMMLEPVARSVTHIHRNDFFSAHEASVSHVLNSTVRLLFPFWELKRIEGDQWVKRATIVNSQSGETQEMDVDAVVLNTGFLTNLGPLANWGLQIENNSITVDSRMRTNIEGVYAAGDIVTYDGKLKLISTGCGEVAVAVNNAKRYIDPRARVSPGHSTDRHVLVQKKLARQRKREQI